MTDTINYVRLDADNLAELREAAKQALQLLGSHPAPNGGAVYEALNHGLSVTTGAFVDELVDDEDTGPTHNTLPREYAIALYGLPRPTWLQQRSDEDDEGPLPLTTDPVLVPLYTEAEARSVLAAEKQRFPEASFRLDRLATPARIADLEKRLRDIAEGARSKADLIASGSPTSIYTKPVDVLRALAKEAEAGLAPASAPVGANKP